MTTALTTRNKALEINKSANFYGSFAEIGAGQEVARHFFQAGLASQTIAKSMSAYDKTFSDAIYGKGSRFVSEERLNKMLEHEYNLLEERLSDRKSHTCFFSFANTVATSSHEEVPSCHGWMGIRFQKRAGGPTNEIVIHIRMLDRLRLQQQEALGMLGVNLIYAAYKHLNASGPELITSLIDNLSKDRIEINFINFSGPDVEHIDNRLMCLELVRQDITRMVLFGPKGQPLSISDIVYKKNVLVQRGRFRPVTLTNEKILLNGINQIEHDLHISRADLVVLMEISMSQLKEGDEIDKKDFLDRVDTLSTLGHYVLTTNFTLYAQLHSELRRFTDQNIHMVIGAASLTSLFDKSYYKGYHGGLMAAFGHHFDEHSRLYVYPFKTEQSCTTAKTFQPSPDLRNIYQHLVENKSIVDMQGCEDVDTSIHSEKVRLLLSSGNPKWEELVPTSVKNLIKQRKLFGYTGK
jgi:hypothetical protein